MFGKKGIALVLVAVFSFVLIGCGAPPEGEEEPLEPEIEEEFEDFEDLEDDLD
ncbi:hypothetical protein MWH25_07540 [Natroniella acetigena]|uniref:hypothetical protein n=1 Tax=Natroniella acetigena TaxID=52004 RepID=UPI00200AE41C|nr:hypothetical protein [Natroniella acetigena]MCK8827593.1 hypothetical protein [Natroniella acetigena]